MSQEKNESDKLEPSRGQGSLVGLAIGVDANDSLGSTLDSVGALEGVDESSRVSRARVGTWREDGYWTCGCSPASAENGWKDRSETPPSMDDCHRCGWLRPEMVNGEPIGPDGTVYKVRDSKLHRVASCAAETPPTIDPFGLGDYISLYGKGEYEVVDVRDGWVRTPDLPSSSDHWHNVKAGHVILVRRASRVEDSELLRQLVDRYVGLGEIRGVVENDFRRIVAWARRDVTPHRTDAVCYREDASYGQEGVDVPYSWEWSEESHNRVRHAYKAGWVLTVFPQSRPRFPQDLVTWRFEVYAPNNLHIAKMVGRRTTFEAAKSAAEYSGEVLIEVERLRDRRALQADGTDKGEEGRLANSLGRIIEICAPDARGDCDYERQLWDVQQVVLGTLNQRHEYKAYPGSSSKSPPRTP